MTDHPLELAKSASLEALSWLVEMGATDAVGDSPLNRYEMSAAQAKVKKSKQAPATVTAGRMAARITPDQEGENTAEHRIAESAKSIAAQCHTLEELRQAIAEFEGCDLKRTANKMVFADGNPDAPLMFVGEAPGRDEDMQGLPFVGAAGQLLDKMLAALGRDRSSVYISNILNWRPPGNRAPTLGEALISLPFIRRHIQLAGPKVVVCLGGTAAKHLLDTTTGIMRLRGKWTTLKLDEKGDETIPLLPTLHPAYLLRQPAHKSLAWTDFLAASKKLETVTSEQK